MNILNKMPTSKRCYSHLLLLLISAGISQTALADGCENTDSKPPYNINMLSTVGDIKLSGNISKHQEIGRFNFSKDASGTTDHVADCGYGATIYAVAGSGEPPLPNARYFEHIDGHPTYIISNSYNGDTGNYEYAYALIDNETGRPFGDRQYYSEIKVNDDKMRPRPATVILYAAVDNPTKTIWLNPSSSLGGLRPKINNPDARIGITYKFKSGSISPAPASCDLNNPDNLTITLPRSPITAFKEIGDVHAKENTELSITCTGEMTGKILLNLSSHRAMQDDQGRYSVIKNEREGGEHADGIGFVLSTNGRRISNGERIDLPNLGKGITQIPIDAEYYRYGYKTSAGRVQAIANFVVEFN